MGSRCSPHTPSIGMLELPNDAYYGFAQFLWQMLSFMRARATFCFLSPLSSQLPSAVLGKWYLTMVILLLIFAPSFKKKKMKILQKKKIILEVVTAILMQEKKGVLSTSRPELAQEKNRAPVFEDRKSDGSSWNAEPSVIFPLP